MEEKYYFYRHRRHSQRLVTLCDMEKEKGIRKSILIQFISLTFLFTTTLLRRGSSLKCMVLLLRVSVFIRSFTTIEFLSL